MTPTDAILRIRARRHAEGGFTLIEMLIVLAVLAILMAVAVPAYLGFSDRAEVSVAKANVRAVVPAIERFYSDNQTYVGLDNASTAAVPGLGYYDPSSSAKIAISGSPAPSLTSYCITSTAGHATYFKHGPGGDITQDPGPVISDCDSAT